MDQNTEMTAAIIIPWAETDWQAAGRYATRTPVEVNERGTEQIAEWARLNIEQKPVAIYAHDKNPAESTAQALAKLLKTKFRKSDLLEEVALGLWEGLTPEQLKKRFPKAYKQWKEDPSSICPPEGEELDSAIERQMQGLRKIAGKHKGDCIAIVLGPLSFAGIRCELEEKSFKSLWNMETGEPVKYWLNLEDNKAILTTP